MNRVMELSDSYELYEFVRQYYLEIDSSELKELKFPVAVYFDSKTGKPTFKSADKAEKKFKVSFENRGDKYYYESNNIQDILDFIKEKSARRVKPGDKVIVIDNTLFEKENVEFFRDNFIEYEFSCRYDYGNRPTEAEGFVVIVLCGKKVLIQEEKTGKCYIIEERGLKIV